MESGDSNLAVIVLLDLTHKFLPIPTSNKNKKFPCHICISVPYKI